jgi:hypothetical protein
MSFDDTPARSERSRRYRGFLESTLSAPHSSFASTLQSIFCTRTGYIPPAQTCESALTRAGMDGLIKADTFKSRWIWRMVACRSR